MTTPHRHSMPQFRSTECRCATCPRCVHEEAEQHAAHRHLVYDGIEPFDEHQLKVLRFATYLDPDLWLDLGASRHGG